MTITYDFYDLKHLGFDCHYNSKDDYTPYCIYLDRDPFEFEDMDAVDEFVRDVTPESDYKAFMEKYAEK